MIWLLKILGRNWMVGCQFNCHRLLYVSAVHVFGDYHPATLHSDLSQYSNIRQNPTHKLIIIYHCISLTNLSFTSDTILRIAAHSNRLTKKKKYKMNFQQQVFNFNFRQSMERCIFEWICIWMRTNQILWQTNLSHAINLFISLRYEMRYDTIPYKSRGNFVGSAIFVTFIQSLYKLIGVG